MKIELNITIEFDSWFNEDREPKTKEAWIDFFQTHLFPESPILGVETKEFQDMILMNNITIECNNII